MSVRNIVRRRLIITVAGGCAAAAALVPPALGIFGGNSGPPRITPADARKVGAAVMADGRAVALYEAPATSRGRCVVLHVGSVDSRGLGSGGVACQRGGADPQTQPISALVSWGLEGDNYATIVAGRVTRNIQRLELVRDEAPQALPLRDGYFVTTLPNVAASGTLSDTGVSHTLVGYDAAGKRVAALDLQQMIVRAQPPE